MVGLALAIVLASASLIVITVIVSQAYTDVARLKSEYSAEMVQLTTEMARVRKELKSLDSLVGSLGGEGVSNMKLDISQLKLKAGL